MYMYIYLHQAQAEDINIVYYDRKIYTTGYQLFVCRLAGSDEGGSTGQFIILVR